MHGTSIPTVSTCPSSKTCVMYVIVATRAPGERDARAAPARGMPAAGTDVCWEDKVWLQHFPLSRQTVLDYFSNSPVSPA